MSRGGGGRLAGDTERFLFRLGEERFLGEERLEVDLLLRFLRRFSSSARTRSAPR